MEKYCINLNKSPERFDKMKELYSKIVRIEAFDGNTLEKYSNIKYPRNTKQNKYELACCLSHIKAIVTAYKNNLNGVLILEDDISNEYTDKLEEKMTEIVSKSPPNCDCIQLFTSNPWMFKRFINSQHMFIQWAKYFWGACCYYINRKGMRKIYNMFYKDGVYILPPNLQNYVADEIIYKYINTCYYPKPLFINLLQPSTIHNHKEERSVENTIHCLIKQYFESQS